MNLKNESLKLHKELCGKIEVSSKLRVTSATELSLVYSPGVAEPCKEISQHKPSVFDYTAKGNLVAVVTDGTAVLGLGDIGPEAALPVMEGKAVLFKSFAGVDAFPICLDSTDPDKIVEAVKMIAPTFGGINLEDIAAPNCFEIEERLKQELDIPVMHDDQHGTAIVTVAGVINAVKLAKKSMSDLKVVTSGAGAAGTSIITLLQKFGVQNIILCDRKGAIYEGRQEGMNPAKEKLAKITNMNKEQGTLSDVIKGADVFIGVSVAGALTPDDVKSMADNAVVFALANPIPEIMPELAYEAGALVVGTGRSDYPNQVNNVLVFPGVFRGALDTHATDINDEMKMAAVLALSGLITEKDLKTDYVIPNPFDPRVTAEVAVAVAQAAIDSGVARKEISAEEVRTRLIKRLSN